MRTENGDVAEGVEDDEANRATAPGPQLTRSIVADEPESIDDLANSGDCRGRDSIRAIEHVRDGANRDTCRHRDIANAHTHDDPSVTPSQGETHHGAHVASSYLTLTRDGRQHIVSVRRA